jgi:hypothetical protein
MEQYELAIEEQAYPFEEKAITVHESNLELISLGIYNGWIEKSLGELARFVPARYDKPEAESGIIASLETYTFAIDRPEPSAPPVAEEEAAGATDLPAESAQILEPPQGEEEVTAEEEVPLGQTVPDPTDLTDQADPAEQSTNEEQGNAGH